MTNLRHYSKLIAVGIALASVVITALALSWVTPTVTTPHNIIGAWRVAAYQRDNQTAAAAPNTFWVFTRHRVHWVQFPEASLVQFFSTFSSAKFTQVDLQPVLGDTVVLRGICEVHGDFMRVCGGPWHGSRPESFDSDPQGNHTTLLRRDDAGFQFVLSGSDVSSWVPD